MKKSILNGLQRKYNTVRERTLRELDKNFNRFTHELLWRLYANPQSWRYRTFLSPAHQLQLLGKLLFKPHSAEIILTEGIQAETGQPLRVIYIGTSISYSQFVYLLFADQQVTRTNLGSCHILRQHQTAARLAKDADLVILERNSLLKWAPSSGVWASTPVDIQMIIDFDAEMTWEKYEKSVKRSMGNNIRKVRKAGLQLKLANLEENLDNFYDNMHVPYIEQRHKGHIMATSLSSLQNIQGQSELKMIYLPDGKAIAGYFCYRRGKVSLWIVNGILDGDETWLEQGALSALYYLGLRQDFERGIYRIDCGGVAPFENDPIFIHKKRWGFHPAQNPWGYTDWFFWAPDENSPAAGWIQSHPPIAEFARFSPNFQRVKEKVEDQKIPQAAA